MWHGTKNEKVVIMECKWLACMYAEGIYGLF